MRKQLLFCLVLVSVLFFLGVCPAWANPISSQELIEKCQYYDGRRVAFRGEVVGDVLDRGDYAWVNVNDDKYSSYNVEEGRSLEGYNSGQSIWVKEDLLAGKIQYLGDYKHAGDIVEVEGIFHRACPEHGGDMDIHATKIDLTRVGHRVSHPFNKGRALLAFGLLMLSGGLFAINRLKARKPQGQ